MKETTVAWLQALGRKIKRLAPYFVIFLAVAGLYLTGNLKFIDHKLSDFRFQLSQRDASGGLVLVEIDPISLEKIKVWPWPRGLYAVALEKLLAAGARNVAFDMDFSAISDAPKEDQKFEEALARSGGKVILALFKQISGSANGGERHITLTAPIERFRNLTRLAFINVQPEASGLIRRMSVQESWNGRKYPSLSAALSNTAEIGFDSFFIDFGVRLPSIPRISFVDVLLGNFDASAVSGKSVLIGASAVELGDQLAVPVHKVIPGPVLQVLAYESLAQGRALRKIAPIPILAVAFILALFFGPRFAEWSWRRGLVIVFSTFAVPWPLTLGAQIVSPVLIDISPWVLVILLSHAFASLSRIDHQGIRLMFQSIEIRRKDVMMRNVVENSFDGIVTMNRQGGIESINLAAEKMFGRPHDEIVGAHIGRLISEVNQNLPDNELSNILKVGKGRHEVEGRRKDGCVFPLEISITEINMDDRQVLTAFVCDITIRKRQEMELEHQALHDALTNLPNRTLLFDRLNHFISSAKRAGKPLAVLLIDLDRFKLVNDTLGHHIGDILLKQVSLRLQNLIRDTDTVARLGGDEFALLLPEVNDLKNACLLSDKIIKALEKPFKQHELSFEISASIGVAMFPEHGEKAVELIQMADVAMYAAKAAQTGYSVYDAEKDKYSVRHLTLSGELRSAIEEEELVLHYQPKVDLVKGRISGVEALVRWIHPKLGFLPPDEFIGLAEQTGLIRPLTLWVLDTAAKQCAEWRRNGYEINVAINLSARHLQDLELPNIINQFIKKWDLSPEWMIMEVTESAIMIDPARAMEVIKMLDESGVRLSIDDFGTGYSSLAYLKDLPADELKIDMSFVINMDKNESDRMIVESTINLAQNLGLVVIAEGVENKAINERLCALGCDYGQGYLFSRPLPIEAFEEWLVESPWGFTPGITDAGPKRSRMQPVG